MSEQLKVLMRPELNINENDATKSLHYLKTAQALELRYLIRRFEIQLRYGCNNQQCNTSNCLSYRRRNGLNNPTRRPSPLTARMMACHLASCSDPYSKLCPNQPPILPQQLDMHPDCFESIKRDIPISVELMVTDHVYKPPTSEIFEAGGAQLLHTEKTIKLYWRDNLASFPGANPDRKSLTQNLFNTASLRSFLWVTSLEANPEILRKVLAISSRSQVPSTVELKPLSKTTEKEETRHTPWRDFHHAEPTRSGVARHYGSLRRSRSSSEYLSHLKIGDLVVLKELYQEIDRGETFSATEAIGHKEYVERTLYHTLGTAEGLKESFRQCFGARLPDEKFGTYVNGFNWKGSQHETIILDHLSHAIDALFVPPPHWESAKPESLREHEYIDDNDAVHMLSVCWFALVAWAWPETSVDVPEMRGIYETVHFLSSVGYAYEDRCGKDYTVRAHSLSDKKTIIAAHDTFRSEPAQALANKALRALAARTAFAEAETGIPAHTNLRPASGIYRELLDSLSEMSFWCEEHTTNIHFNQVVGNWLVTIIYHNWQGQMTLNRWEPTGAALELLSKLHRNDWQQYLLFIEERYPTYTSEWLLNYVENYKKNPNVLHLVNFPTFFETKRQVKNFRALNYARMCEAYKHGIYAEQLYEKLQPTPDSSRQHYLEKRLERATSKYLALNVRRDHLLEDALDQLWGRERRELMRPLKVRMGMELHEAGVDQGGVSQEFFRLVFQKAFDLDAGIFVKTDEHGTWTWPHPNSHEPLSTYQLLGLLTALGIYNGITLPVSFPLIWYMGLIFGKLGGSISWGSLPDINTIGIMKDGWPTLYKSFESLFNYDSDKVEEDLGLDWTYSYESNGHRYHIDMWKSKDTEGPNGRLTPIEADKDGSIPVTGENRAEYITNYLRWMCKETVYDQLDAFTRGFKIVIDDAALSVLTGNMLRMVTEGNQNIDIGALERVTNLEGYTYDHPFITWFWEIVKEYPVEKHKALLNFVTAIDRAPVHGIESLHFTIVRHGGDSELLPTSSTCFGKLMIPEYSDKEKLKNKLDLALENSVGFGQA